jgi:serralysin
MPDRPSLTTGEAAVQLTRSGASLSDSPGTPTAPLTFGFLTEQPSNPPYVSTGWNEASTFFPFSEAEKPAARLAVQLWADVANINFAESTGPSRTLDFARFNLGSSAGLAWFDQGGPPFHRYVWISSGDLSDWTPSGLPFMTLLHEIGHQLGLSHPGDYDSLKDQDITYQSFAAYVQDDYQYSVMSYFNETNTGASYIDRAGHELTPETPQIDDIAAVQRLYGANLNTRADDTVYGFNSNADRELFHLTSQSQEAVFTVWDAGGNDTFNFSGYGTNQIIDLRAEHFSSVGTLTQNVAIAANVLIENAVGGFGNDLITGNEANNTLRGGAGNDTLDAGPGNDMLDGEAGDDTAAFSQSLSNYTVERHADGAISVVGPIGSDVLPSIERIRFSDGTIDAAGGNGAFDAIYYARANLDVFHAGANGLDHYNQYGWHEGRDPNAYFSTNLYLAANKDVKAANINPLDHYDQAGWKEGRDPGPDFDTTLYLIHNPDVKAAGIDPLAHYLQFGQAEGRQAYQAIGRDVNGFDAEYYLFHNPDVAAAGVDALQHYLQYGWKEGRNPNPHFDDAGYLAHYADVAAAGINPLEHYEQYGWKEGRDPSASFDTLGYLAANKDVADAGVNPLDHFLQFGLYEGRAAVNDGIWH